MRTCTVAVQPGSAPGQSGPHGHHCGGLACSAAFHVYWASQPLESNCPLGASQPEPMSPSPEPQLPRLPVGVPWVPAQVLALLTPQLEDPASLISLTVPNPLLSRAAELSKVALFSSGEPAV